MNRSRGNQSLFKLLLLFLISPAAVEAQDYLCTTNNGSITITQYTGPGGGVTIPDTINGMPVTSIGSYAFAFCSNLTSVVIPDGVTSLGSGAFQSCSSLAGVTIPDSVTSIGNSAFEYCTSLNDVAIPPNLTSLADRTFFICTNLTRIVIPGGVTSIGIDAFSYCSNLTSVSLPDSVTSLGIFSFNGCASLAAIVIPAGVTNLSDYAFHDDTSLTGVYFEGNAPADDSSAFDGANQATVFHLPGTAGWGAVFDGRPTALWKPQIETTGSNFGVRANQFGFNLNWASGLTVIIEASTNLANPSWTPLQTNFLATGSFYFSDPLWTNYPSRLYRLRWP